MEVKINKEIRNYREKLLLGLDIKQIVLCGIGLGITIFTYMTISKSNLPDIVVLLLSLVVGIIPFGGIAIVQIEGKHLGEWVKLYLKYQKAPKIYKSHCKNTFEVILKDMLPDSDPTIEREPFDEINEEEEIEDAEN